MQAIFISYKRNTLGCLNNFGVYKNIVTFAVPKCPGGGIGRRVGLKNQYSQGCTGSIPVPGT